MIIKIAIQGEAASFHAIAAEQYFGNAVELIYCDSFESVFEAVASQNADYAVCAIENSLFGSINQTYDLLVKHQFLICGEVYLRIEQNLIALPATKLADIKEVYSHPVALAQCQEFLKNNLPETERVEYGDTAGAVRFIKETNNRQLAAIASQAAADLYGLAVLESGIETNKQNYTRFIVLQRQASLDHSTDKSSLIIRTSHQPGALHDALGVFAKHKINLSKLQSRPIIGKAWHYMFYVDISLGAGKLLDSVIDELSDQDCQVKLLGSYKNQQTD